MGTNTGIVVDSFNRQFRLHAVPWCGTCISAARDKTASSVRSARARDHAMRRSSVTIETVLLGTYTPKPGDIVVKKRRGGYHVDIIESYDKETKTVTVIGGNVSDAVTRRIMKITTYTFISPA